MFKYMFNRYYPIDSKIHKVNAPIKIMCLIWFLISLSFVNNYFTMLIMILVVTVFIYMSNVPTKSFLNVVKSTLSLVIFMLIITLVFNESFTNVFLSILKLLLGIIYTNIVTFTTSTSEMIYGIKTLLNPLKLFKLNPNKIAMSIALALQFIPNIFVQIDKIMKSQACRGIDFKYEKIDGKIKALSSMILPILYLTLKRSDQLADAMAVRLYDYNSNRTNYKQSKRSKIDEHAILIHFLIFILVIVWSVIL